MKKLALTVLSLALLLTTHPAAAQQNPDVYAAAELGAEGAGVMRGTATLEHAGAGSRVLVTMGGLAPGGAVEAHIHKAGCDGPVLYTLNTATTDSAGAVQSSTTIAAVLDFAGGDSWYVDVHPAGSKEALCGRLNPAMTGGGLLPPPEATTTSLPVSGSPDGTLPETALALLGLGALAGGLYLRRGHRDKHLTPGV